MARRINPETAEVFFVYALIANPYGDGYVLPPEAQGVVGRSYFAVDPHENVAVFRDDLPFETIDALRRKRNHADLDGWRFIIEGLASAPEPHPPAIAPAVLPQDRMMSNLTRTRNAEKYPEKLEKGRRVRPLMSLRSSTRTACRSGFDRQQFRAQESETGRALQPGRALRPWSCGSTFICFSGRDCWFRRPVRDRKATAAVE